MPAKAQKELSLLSANVYFRNWAPQLEMLELILYYQTRTWNVMAICKFNLNASQSPEGTIIIECECLSQKLGSSPGNAGINPVLPDQYVERDDNL